MPKSILLKRNILNRIGDRINRWRDHPIERDLTPYLGILHKINAICLESLSDELIGIKSKNLIQKATNQGLAEDFIIEGFALIREAAYRKLGMRAFDVQILAALALSQDHMIEMPTGEGKTLVAVFPACLSAMCGKQVHIFTANDYLARRDARWMGPIYRMLGLTVSHVQENMARICKKNAYAADITYVTAKEAGFDFLRDHLCHTECDIVLPEPQVAIVDEADFILIDEARIPLVIAGERVNAEIDPRYMNKVINTFVRNRDYEIDDNRLNVYLTEEGLDRAESILQCGDLHKPGNELKLTALNLALHAEVLLKKNVDYILRNGKIELIDEFTGRVADKRRWPDGIQPAVEAKEGLPVQKEGKILGSISLQHFLRLYPKICGMTATATPAAEELKEIYGLTTVVIPPHKRCIRIDHPDSLHPSGEDKIRALTREIKKYHRQSRPILVGTSSVRESEEISRLLRESGLTCQVLNAKNDEEEAKIIARAGALNAITISTNMAGRGTDIRLGGHDEKDSKKVKKLGGLVVIGTNRHESLRIDLQLRGRAGRQGDPGSSRFFICPQDDLIERYHLQSIFQVTTRSKYFYSASSNRILRRDLNQAQRIVEAQNSEIRKTLFQYTQIIEGQRKTMAQYRQLILKGHQSSGFPTESTHRDIKHLSGQLNEEGSVEIIREMILFHIDNHWSEHLARVADIREGIHLFRLSGQIPLDEYTKRVQTAFNQMNENMGQAIIKTLEEMITNRKGAEFENRDFSSPSSTWTYMLNDNPFSNLGTALISSRNIGFAVGAARSMILYAPLFLMMMLIKKKKKINSNPE